MSFYCVWHCRSYRVSVMGFCSASSSSSQHLCISVSICAEGKPLWWSCFLFFPLFTRSCMAKWDLQQIQSGINKHTAQTYFMLDTLDDIIHLSWLLAFAWNCLLLGTTCSSPTLTLTSVVLIFQIDRWIDHKCLDRFDGEAVFQSSGVGR